MTNENLSDDMARLLADRIKIRMKELGHTGTSLSREIGASAGFVRDLMIGGKKGIGTGRLVSIAKALGCSVAYLLGETPGTDALQPSVEIKLEGSVASGVWRIRAADFSRGATIPAVLNPASMQNFNLYQYLGESREYGLQERAIIVAARPVRPITVGDLVVVERSRETEIERSVRRVTGTPPSLVVVEGDVESESIALDKNWKPIDAKIVGIVEMVINTLRPVT